MKNDLKQMGLFAIGPFFSKALSFILLPIISYYVSLADYGEYTLFTVFLLYFQTFVTLTTEQFYLRVYTSKSAVNIRRVLFSLFFSTTFICFSVLTCFFLIGFISYERFIVFVMALFVSYFTMVQDIYCRTFRARNLGKFYSLSTVITQVANFLFCIFLVFLMRNIFALMLGQLVSMIIGALAVRSIVKNKISVLEDFSTLSSKKFIYILKKALNYSLPLLPGVFLWVVQTSIGRIFLSGDETLLGIFGVGFKLSSITNLFVTSFLIFWEPKIFNLYDKRNSDIEYLNFLNKYRALYSFMIELAILLLIVFNPVIMMFMSKDYQAAMYIFPIMSLSSYINGFNYFEGFGPQLTGKTNKTIIPLVFSLFVNVILLFLFGKDNILIVAIAANVGLIVQLVLDAQISNKIVPKIGYFNTIIRILLYNFVGCFFYLTHYYKITVLLTFFTFVLLNLKGFINLKNIILHLQNKL